MPLNPEDAPDKTIDELDEETQKELEDDETIKQEMDDMQELFKVMSTVMMLAQMFMDGHITLREYVRLGMILEDYERELDVSIL